MEYSKVKVIEELRKLGTEQNRALYRRIGATGEVLGVSLRDLDRLRRRILRDDKLAHELWKTGIMDCRCLATFIADPTRFTELELDAWAADIDYYPLADYFVSKVVIRSKHALKVSLKWMKSKQPFIQRCGFSCIAILAKKGAYEEKEMLDSISAIRRSYLKATPIGREAMNGALIVFAGIPAVHKRAEDVAGYLRDAELAMADSAQ